MGLLEVTDGSERNEKKVNGNSKKCFIGTMGCVAFYSGLWAIYNCL